MTIKGSHLGQSKGSCERLTFIELSGEEVTISGSDCKHSRPVTDPACASLI